MNWLASDAGMVGKLIIKDWQVYQKQLAGFVAGLLLMHLGRSRIHIRRCRRYEGWRSRWAQYH